MSSISAQDISIDTIIRVKKKTFLIQIKSLDKGSGILSVLKNHKIVLSEKMEIGGINDIEFLDFNHDGYPDFIVTYFANNESNSLYLFDQKANTFKKIENFFEPLSSKQLKSDNRYYYTYQRAGCSDYNWKSSLFKIVDFKVVHLAQIEGTGCKFEIDKNPQSIKVFDKKSQLIETLSYKKNIATLADKWTFTEKYWNKNYIRFK